MSADAASECNAVQGLTPKQSAAVLALLSRPTLAEAAKAAHVNAATLWRWQQLPVFAAAFRQAQRAALGRAIAALHLAATEAVETLRAAMRDAEAPAASRVAAARATLDLAVRGSEAADIEQRLAALEARLRP